MIFYEGWARLARMRFLKPPHSLIKSAAQGGSVMVWILVGIGLLAALTFAFIRSNRGSTAMVSTEVTKANAHEILDYANSVKTAVRRMKLRGVGEDEICFFSDAWGDAGYNYGTCSTPANRVFDAAGGGVLYKKPPITGSTSAAWRFMAIQMGNVGDDAEKDLVMEASGVTRNLCLKLNEILGVTNTAGEPPTDESSDPTPSKFDGTFPAEVALHPGDVPETTGKQAYCRTFGGAYFFDYVLVSR